jgi:hypothetical protein
MMDIKDFYILGLPIETELGLVRFLKVKEYPDYFSDLQIISINKNNLIYKYKQINKNGELTELINELEKITLFEAILSIPELSNAYTRVFSLVFDDEDKVKLINNDNFDYFRKLILNMNCTKEEIINPNPEIQKAIERSRRVKSMESEPVEFSDIVTSVVGYNGLSYSDINEFTIYQLYMTYHRIGHFKNYDTTTLFKTAFDNVDIGNWSKHIDLFEDEKHFVTQDQFKKTTGKVLNE